MTLSKLLAICFLLILTGCSNHNVSIDDLKLINNRYFYKETNQLFEGVGISRFESGRISCKIDFKSGIPTGSWVTFGYEGEIIQQGIYKPIYLKKPKIGSIEGIERINLCFVKENDNRFIDLFIISNSSESKIDKSLLNTNYKALVDTLKSNKIKINIDSINEILIVKGEVD